VKAAYFRVCPAPTLFHSPPPSPGRPEIPSRGGPGKSRCTRAAAGAAWPGHASLAVMLAAGPREYATLRLPLEGRFLRRSGKARRLVPHSTVQNSLIVPR
jgi:hypothetical protein